MPTEESQIPGSPDYEITGSPDMKFSDDSIFGRAIHTPGHSPGSTCYYFPSLNLLSTGDTLFQQSIGRTDLWGSDFAQLKRSVQEKLYTLPGETLIIPGHGGKTKIHLEAEVGSSCRMTLDMASTFHSIAVQPVRQGPEIRRKQRRQLAKGL
jgi:glyoxylase-like metal-dependent hydrolase (beta-lactamase superfamily II)